MTAANTTMVQAYWQRLDAASPGDVARVVQAAVTQDIAWHGPHPINALHGATALANDFWVPLRRAFPQLQRETQLVLSGAWAGGDWVSGTGYLVGTWVHPWLGLSATGTTTRIRWGEFCRVQGGQIAETYLLLDLVDLLRQTGALVLPPDRGDTAPVPSPQTGDGLPHAPQAAADGRQSMALVEAMIAGLMRFDGHDLASMDMPRYWHPHMRWYGPAGIGTAYGLAEYYEVHARPFLHAFPDRKGGDHKARIAEGQYVASTGWPSVRATHTGNWLGQPASGLPVGMRVMDWWRCEHDQLVENWVLIDIVDMFRQWGVDLFERAR
jgi:predicted ester cyclase